MTVVRALSAWMRAGIVPCRQPEFLQNFGEFVPEDVGARTRRGQIPFRPLLDGR